MSKISLQVKKVFGQLIYDQTNKQQTKKVPKLNLISKHRTTTGGHNGVTMTGFSLPLEKILKSHQKICKRSEDTGYQQRTLRDGKRDKPGIAPSLLSGEGSQRGAQRQTQMEPSLR